MDLQNRNQVPQCGVKGCPKPPCSGNRVSLHSSALHTFTNTGYRITQTRYAVSFMYSAPHLRVAVGGRRAGGGQHVEQHERVRLVVQRRRRAQHPTQAVYAEVAVGVTGVYVVAHLASACVRRGLQVCRRVGGID